MLPQVCWSYHAHLKQSACLGGHARVLLGRGATCRKVLDVPKIGGSAAFYTLLLLVRPLCLCSKHIVLSDGLLRIIAIRIRSVTKDMARASVSMDLSLVKARLMGLLARIP